MHQVLHAPTTGPGPDGPLLVDPSSADPPPGRRPRPDRSAAAPRGGRRAAWWPRTWPTLVPAVVLSVVYGCTVQRGTGNAFSVDTTKFEYVGLVLGTAHPPGYPLYTLLNAAFVRLVPVGSTALLANLLSAVFAVLTCVVAVAVLRDLGLPRLLRAAGATALGLLPALWDNAVVAEVYSLSALFLVAVLACLLRFERTRRPAWLRLALLLVALSFAHATTTVLLVPGLLLHLALRRPRWLLRPRELVTLLPAGVLLALLPYAYLPWRTAAARAGASTWVETQVVDLHSMWAAMTGAQFGDRMFVVPWDVVRRERLPVLADAAVDQLGPLLLLAAVGAVVLTWRRPVVAVVTTAWAGCVGAFVLTYQVDDWLTLLLPVWLVLALWTLVGLHAGLGLLRRHDARPGAAATVVVALVLPVAALVGGYGGADRSGPDPQRGVDAAVAALPEDSLVFTPDLEVRQQFVYRLLPDGTGARRRTWVSEGSNHSGAPEGAVHWIEAYCAPEDGPWWWPWYEQPSVASVPRGLNTFLYGDGYASQVAAQGFSVERVRGQLHRFACPRSVPDPAGPGPLAAPR